MNSKINMSHDGRVMTVTYYGHIDIDEILASIRARMDHNNGETIKKLKVLLLDHTYAESIDMSNEDIIRSVEENRKIADINPDITFICIMPRTVGFGLSRMWQIYAEIHDVRLGSHLVKTAEEANSIIQEILQQA